MAIKQYPLGIQTFERIRKEDKLYIDKTEYIYHMTHSDGTYFFVGRPRRFGKSLLVSTMQSYFEGKKDLFKGLAMEQLEKEWIEYPVIHLDMSGGKYMSDDQLQRYLIDLVEEQERKFGFHNNKIDVNLRLKDLIMALFQTTGKKVVVLIDEYDAPTEDMTTLMPLLYQSGYLTIKDYNREYNYYTLDIPNKEVKIGLTKVFNFDSSKGNIEDWVIE